MSTCWCSSYRALSRSSRPQTLTPFLYQTCTLSQQQHHRWTLAAHHPVRHRNASSYSRPGNRTRTQFDHDVPFEDEVALPPTLEQAEKARRETTITGSERAAFEKLYKKFKSPEKEGADRKKGPPELDQIADEWYEDDEDNMVDGSGADLDSLFEAAMSGKPAATPKSSSSTTSAAKPSKSLKRKKEDLVTLAKDILKTREEEAKRKLKHLAAQNAARLKIVQKQELARVKGLLESAKTDQELWQILKKEVFAPVQALNLEANSPKNGSPLTSSKILAKLPPTPTRPKRHHLENTESAHSPSPQDPRVLFNNYPHLLYHALYTLRRNFPASQLPTHIIPTLKSYGRSTYALGATTSLYSLLIRTAWHQSASYTQICDLLQDMDNGGIEIDASILSLIDKILAEWNALRTGKLGQGPKHVFKMEIFKETIARLRGWREVVAKRLGVWDAEQIAKAYSQRNNVAHKKVGGPSDMILDSQMDESIGTAAKSTAADATTDENVPMTDVDIPFVDGSAPPPPPPPSSSSSSSSSSEDTPSSNRDHPSPAQTDKTHTTPKVTTGEDALSELFPLTQRKT